jgi:hypothetical protein
MKPRRETTAIRRGVTGLDVGARQAMLRILLDGGATHNQMLIAFFRAEAFGDLEDYLAAVQDAWGPVAEQAIRAEMRAMRERYTDDLRLDWEQASREAADIYGPIALLTTMPAADFLTLVEVALGQMSDPFRQSAAPATITAICARRGVPYRLVGVGASARFEWTGDAITNEQILEPALSAMDDPRLAGGPRADFDDARKALRDGTPTGRRRAVAEACNAVESALKVLLAEHGRPLPATQSLDALLSACRDAGLFPAAADGKGVPIEQILAGAGRFGNRRGRHGAGAVPHAVELDEAEAVVAASAVALTFIARRLPART